MGVLRGIELACRERGQDILLSPWPQGTPVSISLRPYRQRKADGMVYIGLQTMSDALVAEIEDRSIPCVVVGDRPDRGSLSWVDTDNEGAGYATTRPSSSSDIGASPSWASEASSATRIFADRCAVSSGRCGRPA
jgi:DNA-binding LacI/PurR family transcriptional regulator